MATATERAERDTAILAALAEGKTVAELADQYQLSTTRVFRIGKAAGVVTSQPRTYANGGPVVIDPRSDAEVNNAQRAANVAYLADHPDVSPFSDPGYLALGEAHRLDWVARMADRKRIERAAGRQTDDVTDPVEADQ